MLSPVQNDIERAQYWGEDLTGACGAGITFGGAGGHFVGACGAGITFGGAGGHFVGTGGHFVGTGGHFVGACAVGKTL